MQVRGKVAIITGASSGIGCETARIFARAGAKVVLAARRVEQLQALAAELQALGADVLVAPADVTDRASIDALVNATVARWKRVDIVINNAGVGLQANVAALSPDDLRYVFAVNVFGPVGLIQAALPHMRPRRQGMIVNVSSPVAPLAFPGIGGYAASKLALDVLSDTLRRELYGSGIGVLTVYPGRIDTNFDQARIRVTGARRVGRSPFAGSALRVAQAILRGVERQQSVVYVLHPLERLACIVHALAPRAFDGLIGWWFARRQPAKSK